MKKSNKIIAALIGGAAMAVAATVAFSHKNVAEAKGTEEEIIYSSVSQEELEIPSVEISTQELVEAPVVEVHTQAPTQAPTEAPVQMPTEAPTQDPTEAPTEAPATEVPSQEPTVVEDELSESVSSSVIEEIIETETAEEESVELPSSTDNISVYEEEAPVVPSVPTTSIPMVEMPKEEVIVADSELVLDIVEETVSETEPAVETEATTVVVSTEAETENVEVEVETAIEIEEMETIEVPSISINFDLF